MSFQAPKGVNEYVPPRGALFVEAREAFTHPYAYAQRGRFETALAA